MNQSPRNQNPKITLAAMLSMLCLLVLVLTPGAAAAARSAHRRADMATYKIRVENGIVTDDDGFIGNSASGADHAPRHSQHHRAHRRAPLFDTNTGMRRATAPTLAVGRTLGPDNGNGTDGTSADGGEGILSGDGPLDMMPEDGTNGENAVPPANDLLPDAQDGVVDDNSPSDDATAQDEASILPWIFVIIAVLAVVLIALALIPKKDRSHK